MNFKKPHRACGHSQLLHSVMIIIPRGDLSGLLSGGCLESEEEEEERACRDVPGPVRYKGIVCALNNCYLEVFTNVHPQPLIPFSSS